MNPERFEIFIACIPGLERELLAEIKQIGFNHTKLMVGGVSFFGDWRDVWRANFYLRGATKVLMRFTSFRVTHLAQLDKLSHIADLEYSLDAEVRGGLKIPDPVKEMILEDNVKFVDD